MRRSPIEMAMVGLLVVVLAAIALPNFVDFRSEAKDAQARKSIRILRAALASATSAIQLKGDPHTLAPRYPSVNELRSNEFESLHPQLVGTNLLDPSTGIPPNPWSREGDDPKTLHDCSGLERGAVLTEEARQNFGWCYNPESGEVWANSTRNGASAGSTENTF